MKPNSSFLRRAAQKFHWLALGLLCQSAMLVQAANNPSITGTSSSLSINDTQTSVVYNGATVTQGNTNVLTVTVDFAPTTLGGLAPLPAGVVQSGTNYLIAVTNDADATTILGQLTFTPVANLVPVGSTSNVVFHVIAADANGNSSSLRTTTLHISGLNDAPVLTASGSFTINDKQTSSPFQNVMVTDPDNQGQQSETVAVTLDTLDYADQGFFTVGSSGFTSNNLAYIYTGTASSISNAIKGLVFVPIENQLPVGQTATNVFTINVTDGTDTVTNNSVRVVVLSTNDAPTLTGTTATHIKVATGQTISPFSLLTLGDVDHNDDINNANFQNLNWTVTLTGASPRGNLGSGGSPIGTSFIGSNAPAAATVALRNLTYIAPNQTVAGTNVLTLAITADDGHGGTVSNNVYLDLYSIVLPPGLSGTQSGQNVYDNTSIAPFSKVNIQSFNGNSVTIQIRLGGNATNDIKGTFINLGSFTKTTQAGAPSLYQFSGTSEAATAAIQALLFQPTPNRILGSSSDLATFGITLIDGVITNAPDYSTTVNVLPVNDPPVMVGTSPLVTIQDNQTITPFSTVLISDVDESGQQRLSMSITLDVAAKGAFSSNSVIASGFTNTGSSYILSGTSQTLTTAIRQLVFVPTPGRVAVGLTEITSFTVILNDGYPGGTVANNNTAVRVASVSGAPVVNVPSPQPVSIPVSTNIQPFQSVTISDATALKVGIRINNTTQGIFTPGSVTSGGFTNSGGGNYLISGVASNITAALQQLVFSPATNLPFGSVINFTINVTNSLPNFVSVNHAIVLRTVRNSFIVTKLTDYDPAGSTPANQKEGTLRKAIADAKSGDHITFDIRSAVAGIPDYPAVIRLQAPMVLNNDVILDGPGADRLTISGDSNADGAADVQLFTVNASVIMNRLTFAQGHADFAGGAFEVTPFGDLKLSYCAVTDCRADIWGGGIDVDGGSLIVDHTLLRGNSTSSELGQGGGAVSLYTDQSCTFLDTTFATNRQNAVGGLGGGALYAETIDPGTEFDIQVLSCTFHDNVDAAGHGSSIRPNVFNTFVKLQNTILADGLGKNIEMDQSGAVLSLGGNISDDGTATIFSAGGTPLNTFIFRTPADQTNIPTASIMAALTNNGGPTLTYALLPGSSALNASISNFPAAAFYSTLGTDQRGYFRTNSPDIGAFELNASQRVIIEEIGFNPAPPNTNDQFIEFYVPRDSAPLNISGFTVLVDGVARHSFTNQMLQPGEALVLFSAGASVAARGSVPSQVHQESAPVNLQLSHEGGLITLLNATNQTVYEADYVGAFVSTDPNDYGNLSSNYQSVVLSPQFQGVFLPYQRVVAKDGGSDTNGLSHPGYDTAGKPLTVGNAPPTALADVSATDARTFIPAIPILVNDIDPDITDTLRVVGVGTNGSPDVSGVTNYSTLGARIVINNSPTNGASISYDPTASAYLTALPQGSNVVDTFQYTILDYSNNIPHLRGGTSLEITQNLAKATATVTVNVIGVNSAPTPANDNVGTSAKLTTREDTVLDFTTATNILENDTDPNSDDNSTTLSIVSICETNAYVPNRVSIVTALGATAVLDVRFDRNETHITYDPRSSAILNALGTNQTASDTFYYSVTDRYGVVGTASVTILVTGVNDPPTAQPDSLATDEDTPITVPIANLLANDLDPDNGTVLGISTVTPFSTHGASVQIVGTNIIYDPTISTNLNALAQKEFAADTFTYTLTDNNGLTSSAVVTVTVAGRNDAPISQPDFYTNNEDTLFIQGAPGVLANDREPDINGLAPDDSFRVIPFTNLNTVTNPYTGPGGGAPVTMTANGSFTFDPRVVFDWMKQGDVALDSFSYVVMDHSLSIANDDSFAVTASTTNNILPVLANDVVLSQAGGGFTLTGVTIPSQGGSASLNAASNAIVYTPAAGFAGTETFTYTVADGLGGTDKATVTVTLTASTLYANADAFTVAKGTTNVLDLLANDSLIPATGAGISITALGTPSLGGSVSLNGAGPNNVINYTPNPTNPAPAVETFCYTITSGTLTATGMVSVTVIDRSNVLAANNDHFTVIAGSGNSSLDVLVNDVVLPGPTTNLVITSFTTNNVSGTVSLNTAHTRLVYKPSSTVSNLSESVTYTMSDGAGGTASASVLIQVVTNGFFANDDTFVVVKNSTNTLPVMVNDVILPNLGQTLFISGLGVGTNAPSHGAVAINGPGTGLIYTPTPNYNGGDDFTYEISDGSPARALGHVHVAVLDNSPAKSNPDTYRVQRESANNPLLVLANDYTLPKTPGAFTITGLETNGVHGLITLNGTGTNNSLLYSPNAGFIGHDAFSYEFADTFGNRGTNSVSITVGNLAPLDDAFNVVSGSQTNFLYVRANDYSFPDTNALRAIYSLGTPDHGGVVVTSAGATAVLYTPAPGFVGVEHFSYQLKDDSTNIFSANVAVTVRRNGSDRDTNVVTMTVVGVNDLPTIAVTQGIFNITDKQTVPPFATVVIGDRDEYGFQTNTVTVKLDNAAKGVLTNLGGFIRTAPGVYQMQDSPPAITASLQTMVFIPTENRIIVPNPETTTFTILANDGYAASPTTNTVAVNVTPVNDAPIISGTVAGQTVYDRATIMPFTSVLITEVDNSRLQPLRCTVTLDSASKGVLSSLGGFADLGGGVYSIGASNGIVTVANITAAIRGLVFTPTTANRVTPSTPETTRFTIRVDDFFAVTVVNSNTTVIAKDALTAEVMASDRLANAQFGWAVATLRDLAVVGAPHDTSTNAGSVYLYARSLDGSNTWTQIKKLMAPDAHASDAFGTAVAISGDSIIVGAPFNNEKAATAGAAYVYSRNQNGSNQWGFVKKLMASDGVTADQFGSAIAISNTLVVIGSPLADINSSVDAGAVYFFERDQNGANQWGQVRKLTATNAAAGDHFGGALALYGDNLAVGAPLVDVGGVNDMGAAYIYGRNQNGAGQWGLIKRFTTTNASPDHFGSAVGIYGDNLAVGVPFYDLATTNLDAGAAYVFNRNQNGADQWGQVRKLTLTNGLPSDHFGSSLGLSADSLVVSAPQTDGTNGIDYGSAYLFQQNQGSSNNWGQVDKFLPAAVGVQDNFGSAVAISQGTIVAGAYNGLDSGVRYGTAFMFRINYNNSPQKLLQMADQSVQVGVPFTFAMPAGAFADPDFNELLTYSLGTSPAVPNWLSFDPLTGNFSGTPATVGAFPINLIATDIYGATVNSQFTITATTTNGGAFNVLSAVMQPSIPGRILNLQLTGNPGTTYRLQQTTNLIGGTWTDVGSQTADVNGAVILNVTNPPSPSYFRTVWP